MLFVDGEIIWEVESGEIYSKIHTVNAWKEQELATKFHSQISEFFPE